VYWFTGLSGAGKTTIGHLFASKLRAHHDAVVFLDGDELRQVFGSDLGHSPEDRLKSAMRNARLCKMLSEQGINVVCATISMFRECHNWNRAHIRSYREIWLRASMEVLMTRDRNHLYSRAMRGELSHVVGVDIPADEPFDADIVIENDGSVPPEEIVDQLMHQAVRADRGAKSR
jgi:cytidine diphosphoramidate kinase